MTHDRAVARADLPPYAGPSAPAGGHVHEWGDTIADDPDDGPLEVAVEKELGRVREEIETVQPLRVRHRLEQRANIGQLGHAPWRRHQ